MLNIIRKYSILWLVSLFLIPLAIMALNNITHRTRENLTYSIIQIRPAEEHEANGYYNPGENELVVNKKDYENVFEGYNYDGLVGQSINRLSSNIDEVMQGEFDYMISLPKEIDTVIVGDQGDIPISIEITEQSYHQFQYQNEVTPTSITFSSRFVFWGSSFNLDLINGKIFKFMYIIDELFIYATDLLCIFILFFSALILSKNYRYQTKKLISLVINVIIFNTIAIITYNILDLNETLIILTINLILLPTYLRIAKFSKYGLKM